MGIYFQFVLINENNIQLRQSKLTLFVDTKKLAKEIFFLNHYYRKAIKENKPQQ
jgi:hypothetical protein